MQPTDFEKRYQENSDPWDYRGSWYERRKYALTVASLPRERYRLVWEPACSIGVLTRLLAERADRVIASDISSTAVAHARSGEVPPNVEWDVVRLPSVSGITDADLVVLSEILYYLDPSDRERVLAQAWDTLAPGGDLIVVHWRSSSEDTYLSGDETHTWLRARPGWRHLVTHVDEEFVLDVLRKP
ncbi:class I SAM-dependent methyltransferase [Kineosporia rhizophila]|uniref:class I SAM-dependent DNA methyltransferase n=1 Tax=Kineosporia TaxID=49184 RepID=UPI000AF89119|nr:class I SAM-dependent methyltransferase [Kineosporia sp. NBRC 101677]MCE0539093.1 class I SAM-dependent methyltransferase [Kineosporia rhizophila]GLY17805.1 methyltransferase [Kineosporia sp. NBRC 101677]